MKRLCTHSTSMGLGQGKVFALAACLLAVCIIHAVKASEKQVFNGYNTHYDACVSEAVEASPNTNEESRIIFRYIVPRGFLFNYLDSINERVKASGIQKDDVGDDKRVIASNIQEGNVYENDVTSAYELILVRKTVSDTSGTTPNELHKFIEDYEDPESLLSKAMAASSKESFTCHNNFYYDCVDEAIKAKPKANEQSKKFLRDIVPKLFGDADLMFTFIEYLKKEIYDPENKLEGQTLIHLDEILFKYAELLITKIISDVKGTDFSKIVAEKWPQLRADYRNRFELYRRPWLIPGCRSTNQKSRDIFKDLVNKLLEVQNSMPNYIKNLRQAKLSGDTLDEETLSDVDMIIERYTKYLEGMTKLDLLLEEFTKIFDDGSSVPPRRLQRLAVATSGKDVLADYNNYFLICSRDVRYETPVRAAESINDLLVLSIGENFNSRDLMVTFIKKVQSDIDAAKAKRNDPESVAVSAVLLKYLVLLMTKTISDLEDKDFSKDAEEYWKHRKADHEGYYKVYLNSEEFPGYAFMNEDSRNAFPRIVGKSFQSYKSMEQYIASLKMNSMTEKVSDSKTRDDLTTITAIYIDYIKDKTKFEFLFKKFDSDEDNDERIE